MNFLKSLSKLSFKKFWLPIIISIVAIAAITTTVLIVLDKTNSDKNGDKVFGNDDGTMQGPNTGDGSNDSGSNDGGNTDSGNTDGGNTSLCQHIVVVDEAIAPTCTATGLT